MDPSSALERFGGRAWQWLYGGAGAKWMARIGAAALGFGIAMMAWN
ncbi:MAG: hypothetical protein ACOYXM_06140 [Actinomycetota bacterium]